VQPLLLLALAASVAAQKPPSPAEQNDEVELSANLVTVTVVVRDASGALVTSLTPKDFAVYEDGAPQEIDQLQSRRDLPLRLAFLFDASISVKERLDFERRAASRFFGAVLGPADQAALYSVSTEWKLEQPLTASVPTLDAALGRLDAEGITSLFGAIDGASRYLGSADGRRVIVVLSDGYDTAAQKTLQESLESAQRADAVIFAVAPTGGDHAASPAARVGATALRQLCDQTGGVAFFPPVAEDAAKEAADLDAIYRRVVEEIRAQYVLTYYSSAPASDGRFRVLRVEVKRPGLTVTARKGYYAR
jgi:Ca-activated chloride channel family protein